MQTVKLTRDLFIAPHNHLAGDVVEVADVRAADLIKAGVAEASGATITDVDRSAASKFDDVIWPAPAEEYVTADPALNLAPNVADHPGLVKLAEVAPEKVKQSSPDVRKAATGDFSPSEIPTPDAPGDATPAPAPAPKATKKDK